MATAVQVESIWNGLTDNSGQPLAAGKVYTYSAGTTTPVSLYTSSDKSTSATNPLILDGNGKAQVWADGRYKFVVKTSADVTLYTLDNLLYGFDDTTVLLGGISTGSANAQTVSVPATVESYANGQRITFIAGYTNTGAVTLQFNALSPISVVKGPTPSSLQAGDLLAGQLYSCTYYGGSFYLENSPTPADVQRSRAQLITSITGINTLIGALTPALTSYEVGSVFRFKAVSTNTSAVTINLGALGAKAIQYNGIALTGSEIQANQYYELVYDGTQFQLLNPTLVADVYATGVAGSDTITATVPAIAGAYTTGMKVWFQAAASNTGATTINLNGLGAKTVQLNGAALAGGEIVSARWVELVYDGTNFQLSNAAQESPPRWGGTTGGTSTAFTITPSPAIGAYATGQRFAFIAHVANGAAATLAINGLTATTIQRQGTALVGNEFKASDIIEVVYNGTNFQIVNVSNAPLFVDRTNNRVGIGTTAPAHTMDLIGAQRIADIETDASGKVGRIYGRPYTNANGDWLAIDIRGQNGSNEINIGGGSALAKAATEIRFITAANTTTTSGTERSRIISSGEVLIDRTTSITGTYRLQVGDATGSKGLSISGGSSATNDGSLLTFFNGAAVSGQLGNYSAVQGGAYNGGFTIKNSGGSLYLVGVTAAVGTHFLKWNNSTGAWTYDTSSARYKDNIQDSPYGLAEVLAMRPTTFTYKSEPSRHDVGFIAEEMVDVVPEVVARNLDGQPDAISYDRLTSVLCKAIQELNAKVEALEARVAALEA